MPFKRKEDQLEYQRQWYEKNRDRVIEKVYAYKKANKEKQRAYSQKYRDINKEILKEKKKEWVRNNFSRKRQIDRRWALKNRYFNIRTSVKARSAQYEKGLRDKHKQWRKDHPCTKLKKSPLYVFLRRKKSLQERLGTHWFKFYLAQKKRRVELQTFRKENPGKSLKQEKHYREARLRAYARKHYGSRWEETYLAINRIKIELPIAKQKCDTSSSPLNNYPDKQGVTLSEESKSSANECDQNLERLKR